MFLLLAKTYRNIDFAACFFYFLPSVSLLYSLDVESSLFLSLYVGLDIVQCGQVYKGSTRGSSMSALEWHFRFGYIADKVLTLG